MLNKQVNTNQVFTYIVFCHENKLFQLKPVQTVPYRCLIDDVMRHLFK